MTKHYAEVKAKADFVELEKEVLKFWEEDKTFEKSVRNRDGAAEFVFMTALRSPTARRITGISWFLMSKMSLPAFRP